MSSEIQFCWIHKDGFCLRIEDREHNSKLQSIFGRYFKVKFCKVLWSKIILEANGLSRREVTSQEKKWNGSEGFIQLSKYHKWDYISSPHLLPRRRRIRFRKSRVLYGLIYKFLGETTKDNLFICDGREKITYNIVKYFRFTKCW